MLSENRNLDAALIASQSQSETENQTSAYVYVITKIFPLLATGVFASTTDLKKPESIALSTAMVSSTALPVLSDMLKLSGGLPQLLETIAGFCLFAGVGMMDQGAIKENNQSTRSIISLTAVGCFSLFAMINVVYNTLKLAGCIQGRKPGVELASGSFGLIGSLLFLAGNTLGFLAQQDAGKPIDVPARMIVVASCFTLSTALHTMLAGRAVCARKPEDDVLSEALAAAETERSTISHLSVDNAVRQLEEDGRVIGMRRDEAQKESENFLSSPSAPPPSPRRVQPMNPAFLVSGHDDQFGGPAPDQLFVDSPPRI